MIGAVILAAGQSQRMGRPKMTLPWGDATVIGQVVRTLTTAGVKEIVAVTGGARQQVEQALDGLSVRTAFNPRFVQDEMAFSLQVGLEALPEDIEAALVVLGEQPQMECEVVQAVIDTYNQTRPLLVVPSFQMRRGHPWIIARPLWAAVLALHPPQTLREVINAYAGQIIYLNVERDSILRDLDTAADYERDRP
jgi:molybdenum cofactor cytidylyltransferase